MVLNGTDRDVDVSVEEEAAFYTALVAVSAQFTDVFKEHVCGAIRRQRANHVMTVEEISSLVMFRSVVQSYMSLCQNSLSPDALFRSQLRSTVKAVHQQFSSLFLEEVQLIVGKLRNDIPLTWEESHKVDLYQTVCNAYRVQWWNHDISSSAPFNNNDTIVKYHDSTTTHQVQLHDSVSQKRKLMPNHDEVAVTPSQKSPRLKVITEM